MTNAPCWTAEELRSRLNEYEKELRAAGKARNTITTYVQHPERFINWLVGSYVPRTTTVGLSSDRVASKYEPLFAYLTSRPESVVRLSFGEIERILGQELPNSARRYRPWWANEQEGTHIHARAWLGAGRKTANVDMASETVDFVR
jgi:hypothetical protein